MAGQLKDLPQLGTLREFRVDDLGGYEVGQQVALGDSSPTATWST